mgnify:FL=1
MIAPSGSTRSRGAHGECLALDYLLTQGLQLVERNTHSPYGEIDIIMRDGEEWVFVEVRYRHTRDYGGGLESVTRSKRRKLINTAEHYMQGHHKTHFDACRFDIIELGGNMNAPDINWIKDAFQAE